MPPRKIVVTYGKPAPDAPRKFAPRPDPPPPPRTLVTDVKEYNEELPVAVELDVHVESWSRFGDDDCRHVVDGVVPRVVMAQNEAGYNATRVCLDCLLEWVAAHHAELGYDDV